MTRSGSFPALPIAPGASVLPTAERGPTWWGIDELRHVTHSSRMRTVATIWIAAAALSIATGILNVTLGWNGIALQVFGLPVDLTLYPPFLLSVLLVLWLGPTWGAVPIYLANLASALASGMAPSIAVVFAVAGLVETLMLWGSLVLVRADPDLRRGRDLGWFAAAGLVAAVTGSLAAILWNTSHGLDPVAGQRVWRGWIIGDLAQILVLAPLLRLAGPRVRSWFDRHFFAPPHHEFSYTHGVAVVVCAFAVLGLVVFLGVHQALGSIEIAIDARTADGDLLLPRFREIVLAMGLLSTALIVATGMFSTALARMGERQRREAQLDSLTGCLNRRTFEALLAKEAERSRRLGHGIGLLFLDLDRFKELNDRHGHAIGDAVLQRFAERVEETVRETDLLFRWGGEEFLVMLPHTRSDEVELVAERLREALAERPLFVNAELSVEVTASIGAAWTERYPVEAAALVAGADNACYEAKRLGRDRLVLAPPLGSPVRTR